MRTKLLIKSSEFDAGFGIGVRWPPYMKPVSIVPYVCPNVKSDFVPQICSAAWSDFNLQSIYLCFVEEIA